MSVCGLSPCVRMYLLVLSVVLWRLTTCDLSDWSHHAVLEANYHLYWSPESDSVLFQVTAATTGYVGFGLSPNGAMAGSDVVIGWVHNGEVFFHDRYAPNNGVPEIDIQQDWELLSAWENGTHTTFRFRRKLNTCDDQDIPISNNTARIIYAYHPEDPTSVEKLEYHGKTQRGSKSIMLLQPSLQREMPTDDDLKFWDIRAPNVSLFEDTDTTYWCKVIKAPLLNRKHHVFKIEPMIQPGNERYVHHIVLYRCIGASGRELEPYVHHEGHECYTGNTPKVFSTCESVYIAWGVGGQSLVMPNHAGLSLGDKGNLYFMMETHYDNSDLDKGIVDQSGFRVYYTPDLRDYDAITLMIGATVHPCVIIPPGQKEFVIVGHADPLCLAPAIPTDGIKIFAVFLHSHLLGRKMTVRHFRNNTELEPIAVDKNYDFNYQEYRYLPEEITVLPGDHLIVECTYDSTKRKVTTFGGLGTDKEMCLAFLLYYPRIARARALSKATCNLVMRLGGIDNFDQDTMQALSPMSAVNKSYSEYFINSPWDDRYSEIAENAMRFGYHKSECYLGNGDKIYMPNLVTYPKNFREYKEPNICSKTKSVSERLNLGKDSATVESVSFLSIFILLLYLL